MEGAVIQVIDLKVKDLKTLMSLGWALSWAGESLWRELLSKTIH